MLCANSVKIVTQDLVQRRANLWATWFLVPKYGVPMFTTKTCQALDPVKGFGWGGCVCFFWVLVRYIALHCTAPHHTTLRHTIQLCTIQHYTSLHCTALHYLATP